jgi:hypothetical protein
LVAITLEEFLKKVDDRENLEVIKVDGYTWLYRPKTNELYAVGEPEVKDELPIR